MRLLQGRPAVVFINAEGKARSVEQVEALISVVEAQFCRLWAMIAVAEADFCSGDEGSPTITRSGHIIHRHLPGQGSRALKIIINSRFSGYMKDVEWLGRSGCAHFAFPQRLEGLRSQHKHYRVVVTPAALARIHR